MIFHNREDSLQGEGEDYEAVSRRSEQQGTEGWKAGVEGGQISLYEPCIFCSSVFSVRKRTFLRIAGDFFLLQRISFFLTKDIFFSHRAHRVHWAFWRTFRAHRTPSAYRVHRGLSTNIGCKVLWNRLTKCLCGMLCILFFCVFLWEIECTLAMRRHTNKSLGSFFSHRIHRLNRTF